MSSSCKSSLLPAMSRHIKSGDTLYSRRQVEGLIADGYTIIIVDQKVLKVDPWLKYHPGGDKAIMHMVGRDATDELNACVFLRVEITAFGGSDTDLRISQATLSRGQKSDAQIPDWYD